MSRPLRRRRSLGGRLVALLAGTASVLMLTLALPDIGASATAAPATSAVGAASPAAACTSNDKFAGTLTQVEHFLNCKKIHYDIARPGCSTCTTPTPQQVTPDAGPACQWVNHHSFELCAQQGVWHIVCAGFIVGNLYGCGPTSKITVSSIRPSGARIEVIRC